MKKVTLLFLIIILALAMSVPADAAEAVGKVEAFSSLSGDGQYINNKEYYQLDMVKPGILNSIRLITNGVANLLFMFEANVVNLTCTILYYVSTVDFMDAAGTKVNEVQKSLYDNLFVNSFNFAFMFVGLFLAWLLLRRKYGEILNQFAKAALVCVMAAVIGSNTAWFISMDENITSSVSDYVASAISGGSSGSGYAANVAGQIWSTQIHQPWLTLEFGEYTPSSNDVHSLLTNLKPDSEDREKEVQRLHISSNPAPFAESMRWDRLVFTFLYLIPLLIKNFFISAIVVLQLAFRVLKIFLYFLGVPVMLLSLVPQFGGIRVIESWVKKIFEMSFMIVVLSFMLSIILWFDGILWEYAARMGWLLVIFLQVGITAVVFLFRNKILGFMNTVQNVIKYPALSGWQLREKMNSYGNAAALAQSANTRITQAVKSTGAYHAVESGVKNVMLSWSAGIAGIGEVFSDGNVVQNKPNQVARKNKDAEDPMEYGRRRLLARSDISNWSKATWNSELEKAGYSDLKEISRQLAYEDHRKNNDRPQLTPENNVAAAPKDSVDAVIDKRPQLALYKNPERKSYHEATNDYTVKSQMRDPEKAQSSTPRQKRSAKQTNNETSNTHDNKNKAQIRPSAASTTADIGIPHGQYQDVDTKRPTKKRPALAPTRKSSVKPVSVHDITHVEKPRQQIDSREDSA